MKQLKLSLDDLAIESFATDGAAGVEKGTVQGNGASNQLCNSDRSCLPDTCIGFSCFNTDCYCNVPSYADTCGCDPYATVYYQTCPNSCYATCTCTDLNHTCTCTC